MSLVAIGSVVAEPLPEWIDGDELWLLAATGITFSLRDLSALPPVVIVEELAEEDDDDNEDVAFAVGAIEIFDRTPSPLVPAAAGLGLLLLPL